MMSVSIITINRNNIIGLKTTIASVLNQKYSDFEFIIVDGASSDGSSDLIAAISSDHRVKWVSEPDSGIYNAMNKGVRMSSKDYLLFLNSGDAFHDEFVFTFCLLFSSLFITGIQKMLSNRLYAFFL